MAYAGTVKWEIVGLNIVIIANNNPAKVPSIPNHDKAGFDQVIDALITSKSSERPVLFTTPLIVITPKSEVDPDLINAGKVSFTIDQQQRLQGYMPIIVLHLYNNGAGLLPGANIPSGPGFVDKSNASSVAALAGIDRYFNL